MEKIFLEQPRRGKTREAQLTPQAQCSVGESRKRYHSAGLGTSPQRSVGLCEEEERGRRSNLANRTSQITSPFSASPYLTNCGRCCFCSCPGR